MEHTVADELTHDFAHSTYTAAQELGLEGFGASAGMVSQLVEELVASGELQGALRGGGSTWTPAVYTSTQQAALTDFYEQNGWVGHDIAKRYAREEGAWGDQSSCEGLLSVCWWGGGGVFFGGGGDVQDLCCNHGLRFVLMF